MEVGDVIDRWRACSACPSRKTCRQPIPGEGLAVGATYGAAGVFVVGGAPRGRDDVAGRPFMDEAGRLVREILEAAGVTSAFLTTVAACRKLDDAPPKAAVEACAPRLAELAAAFAPNVIVFVGPFAEAATKGAPWLAGRPTVTIADTEALIARGHPTTATQKVVAAQVVKVKRLIERWASPPRKKKTPDVEIDTGPVGCKHAVDVVGVWRSASSIEPLSACTRCHEILS